MTDIGLGTQTDFIKGSITELAVAKKFRACDVIFGGTDDEWGRAILTKLALSYLIPVFDMGVVIDSSGGNIKSVLGRVTTLIPGSACLFCRGAIMGDVIAAEILAKLDPDEYEQLKKARYVPELPGTAPSVITFTTAVASTAITELLHRITGFMGKERKSTGILLRFDDSKLSLSSKTPNEGCWCASPPTWGEGDKDPFLNLTWANENI